MKCQALVEFDRCDHEATAEVEYKGDPTLETNPTHVLVHLCSQHANRRPGKYSSKAAYQAIGPDE